MIITEKILEDKKNLGLNAFFTKSSFELIWQNFFYDFGLIPAMSIEVEFYLLPLDIEGGDIINDDCFLEKKDEEDFFSLVQSYALENNVALLKVERESGNGQYEFNVAHTMDLHQLVMDIELIKEFIEGVVERYQKRVSFASKPHGDLDMGSGLHLHLSLWKDGAKDSIHRRIEEGVDLYDRITLNSIAGLLNYANDSLLFYTKSVEDLERYKSYLVGDKDRFRRRSRFTNAPTHIAWGNNNRSLLVRIPAYLRDVISPHLEYRLPSADSDLYEVLSLVLLKIRKGIEGDMHPGELVYGNAFEECYKLPPLIVQWEELLVLSQDSSFLGDCKKILILN